jgi:F0F1-type ATP synthase assembly protein I
MDAKDRKYYLFALRIIGDFGATIAVPVVIFVLIGQWLDGKYDKSPWFTISAFILAALLSGKMIYKRAKRYGSEYQDLDKE